MGRPSAAFAPRFTMSLIYLFGFFFLYCFVLITPTLFEISQAMPRMRNREVAKRWLACEILKRPLTTIQTTSSPRTGPMAPGRKRANKKPKPDQLPFGK